MSEQERPWKPGRQRHWPTLSMHTPIAEHSMPNSWATSSRMASSNHARPVGHETKRQLAPLRPASGGISPGNVDRNPQRLAGQ